MTPAAPPPDLAQRWFGKLIPDLNNRSTLFQTDMDMVDEELLELFAQEIRVAVKGLDLALIQGDAAGLRHHAHTLQGMGGTAGAPEISVVGEVLSAGAKAGNLKGCRPLVDALRNWQTEWITPALQTRELHEALPILSGSILVVDDELANRRFLEKLLTDLGADVILAENGEQALEIIREQRPEVALVDVMMSGISGYEVCGTVTRDPELRNTAIIMVTARSTVEDIEHAFVQGAFDYIRKPFHSRELVARVRNALQLKKQNDALRQWKERMSRELEVAGALQARLFNPHPMLGPACELRVAYRPSQHVGGDMFDLLELPDGRLIAFVADVCGHGVASALISTLLKGLVSEVVRTRHERPLHELMNLLHLRFRQYVKDPELYATLLLFRVDPCTRDVEGISCGHPIPLAFSHSGSPLLSLFPDIGGMPIGLFPAGLGDPYAPEDEMRFVLPDGSSLFLYSDGLIEARNALNQECGTQGLSECLEADLRKHGVCGDPVRILDTLSATYRLDLDDCSLLCIHMIPESERIVSGRHTPTLAEAARVAEQVGTALTTHGWSEDSASLVRLLTMEHLANVADHSGLPPDTECSYRLTLHAGDCQLLFRDPGAEWDVSAHLLRATQRVEDGTSERRRGLDMIQRVAGLPTFFRRDNWNHTLYSVSSEVDKRLMTEIQIQERGT